MKAMTENIGFTCLVLLLSLFVFEFTSIDLCVQDYLYNFEAHRWILDKNAVIPKLIFYDGIKKLYIFFVIVVLIGLLMFHRNPAIATYKKGLKIVLLSCISAPLLVGVLKAITNVPCPKDISHYGGDYPYVTVLSKYPVTFQQTKNIKCYPAGHASGGFALMSLYFLFLTKRIKKIALIAAIVIGWSIGGYKMIIGDHFFSHTFITMILSWLLILNINYAVNYFSVNRNEKKPNKNMRK